LKAVNQILGIDENLLQNIVPTLRPEKDAVAK